MSLSYPPQLTGDNSRDILALQSYLFHVVDQFDNAAGQAIDPSITGGLLGVGGDGSLTIEDPPTDVVVTTSSSLSVDQTLFGQINVSYNLPDRAIGALVYYKEATDEAYHTSYAAGSPYSIANLKVAVAYHVQVAGQAANGYIGPLSELFVVTIDDSEMVIKAPSNAEYLVAVLDPILTDERLVTDSATVAWDFTAVGSAVGSVIDLSITTAKLAALAVTTAKIADDAVTTVKIDDDAVTTAKIVNDAVTTLKVVNDAITTAKLPNDAVTYAKIQNVTAASRLLGRGSAAGSGDVEELTVDSSLTLTGTVLSATSLVETGSFTITGTGFTVNPTATARYIKTASIVVLYIPTLTGTSNATTFTLTGLPAAITPTRVHNHVVFARDNSLQIFGVVQTAIGSTTLGVYTLAAGNTWVAALLKTLYDVTLTYSLV